MGLSSRAVILAAAVVIGSSAAGAQNLVVYPARGQGQQQQERDRYECHSWAVQQSGFDPSRPSAPMPAPPPPPDHADGSMLRGGARGAAIGAVGGAIGGNAGKGAAIGAATGALFGGIRQHSRNNEQAAYQQQAANDAWRRAYGACMQGRGYSVQ